MTSTATSVDNYLEPLLPERKQAMSKLRDEILSNLPEGFTEEMSYGMIGYVVPHSLFPAGYHCDPSKPLPFAALASQKNFISFYHMGLYADAELMNWFLAEYAASSIGKPDMGKSCIRFKKPEQIPFALIGKLMQKLSVTDWIGLYEEAFRKNGKTT